MAVKVEGKVCPLGFGVFFDEGIRSEVIRHVKQNNHTGVWTVEVRDGVVPSPFTYLLEIPLLDDLILALWINPDRTARGFERLRLSHE